MNEKTKIGILASGILLILIVGYIPSTFKDITNRSNDPDLSLGRNLQSNNPSAKTKITQDLQTTFGEYLIDNLDYSPSIIPTKINEDLSNIDLQDMLIDSGISADLADHGFSVSPSESNNIYSMYGIKGLPKFISTDLVLHAYHVLYDLSLRVIEGEYLSNSLETMLQTLYNAQVDLNKTITNSEVRTALKANVAYLSVMLKLLNGNYTVNPWVEELVTLELNLIEEKGRAVSPIFGFEEDYTQYTVRGHYTRNDILANYFKAMMYAGRMSFLLNDDPSIPLYDGKTSMMHTQMSLLLISSFNSSSNGKQVWEYWDKIYEPTVFYIGGADDLTPMEYYSIWKSIDMPQGDLLADHSIIDNFRQIANTFRRPMINSMFVYEDGINPISENNSKGMKLMGQRFIPDSYMMQQLVHDKVTDRFMVSGLDVMSVLNSQRAEFHMQEDNQTFLEYNDQINKLRTEFFNVSEFDWVQNLYWQWLYTLLPLLGRETSGYPGFMQSNQWFDKELLTALGSWAELRHDTILYSKQSYTTVTETAAATPPKRLGYVEPNPELYSRLSSLVGYMKNGLETRGLLPTSFDNKFSQFELILNQLAKLSVKELTNQPLSDGDINFIDTVGSTIGKLASFQDPEYSEWVSSTDDKMALIADVHTDPNTNSYLEVGVGNPLDIFVIVQDENGFLRLVKGMTFSYYEFTSNNRLTDEEWQERLASNPPEMPEWIKINLFSEISALSYQMMSNARLLTIRKEITP